MKLSLSVRVAEDLENKRKAAMSLEALAELAVSAGYKALCMRASQLGVQTPLDEVREKRRWLDSKGLEISMVTGDIPIPENTDDAPRALRNITPYLDLSDGLGASLLRIGMKTEEDIEWARRASDEAAERGMRLAHQSHTASLFEKVDDSLDVVRRVGRDNFGIIYEPANLVQCGEDYGPDTIRAFAPHIFNVYFQNMVEKPDGDNIAHTWSRGDMRYDQVAMWGGEGMDFPQIMGTLEEIGYDGYVTLHQAATPPTSPEDFVRRTADYLKGFGRFED